MWHVIVCNIYPTFTTLCLASAERKASECVVLLHSLRQRNFLKRFKSSCFCIRFCLCVTESLCLGWTFQKRDCSSLGHEYFGLSLFGDALSSSRCLHCAGACLPSCLLKSLISGIGRRWWEHWEGSRALGSLLNTHNVTAFSRLSYWIKIGKRERETETRCHKSTMQSGSSNFKNDFFFFFLDVWLY